MAKKTNRTSVNPIKANDVGFLKIDNNPCLTVPDKTRVKHASPPPIARSVYCAQIDMSSAMVFDKNWLRPKDRLAKKRKPIAIHRPSDELESC